MGAPGRRERLRELAPTGPFDDHAALVRRLLDADVSLVTVVDEQGQRFVGMDGLRGTFADGRGSPRRYSLCAVVNDTAAPLVLGDAADDPTYADHPAVRELGIRAYAGVPVRTSDGAVVGAVCALSVAPRRWSPDDVATLEGVRDVVEDRLAVWEVSEDATATVERLELLVAMVGHELGRHLSVVLGGLETATRDGLTPELQRRVLAMAERDARRTIDTLDGLLRADRQVTLDVRPVDLGGMLRAAADLPFARHRVTVDVPAGTVLATDPQALRRIVDNLVDNALRHGGPAVVLRARASEGGAVVEVDDDGPGMPEADVTHLRSPFRDRRLDGSGHGLGLYIIHELVARLGGTIDVDTHEGTVVRVHLPALVAASA